MIDVSVVIPCYRAVDFIEECVESVAGQTGVSVEIIAVEDRSPDETWQALQKLSETYDILRLERMDENSGQARARNKGIDMATGRYVVFLDSDDQLMSSDVLSRWVAVADEGNLDLCVSQYANLFMDGSVWYPTQIEQPTTPHANLVTFPQLANVTHCWEMLYRRAFLDEHDLRFSKILRQREDRLFFLQALLKADRISVTDIDAVLYRYHATSTMTRVDYGQLAMFRTHVELLKAPMDEARAAGKVADPFERTNAARYWWSLVGYWRELVSDQLKGIAASSGDLSENEALVSAFLEATDALTHNVGPLFEDRVFDGSGLMGDLLRDGRLDMARIAVATRDYDVLYDLLNNKTIHHSRLRPLAEASDFPWSHKAVLHYLKFTRGATFAEEKITGAAPQLKDLVKRVILHVGTPKTGSSSLQKVMEENRFTLNDMGVHYPMCGTFREFGIRANRSSGHLNMMKQIANGEPSGAIAARLVEEIVALGKPIDTLVLSCENILSHALWPEGGKGRDLIEKIVRALGVPKIEIAAVFRRQDAWFASYYREVTANPFNDFTATAPVFAADLDGRGLFDYRRVVKELSAPDAVSKVHVTGFGAMNAAGGSIPWFFDLLGVDATQLDVSGEDDNQSLSDAVAGNVRQLKIMHPVRNSAEQVFRVIIQSDRLQSSDFSLISQREWFRLSGMLDQYLAAFDADYPGEKGHRYREGEYLPLSPELTKMLPYQKWHGLVGPRVNEYNIPIAEYVDQYAYMRASASWRITAPLRRFMAKIKR